MPKKLSLEQKKNLLIIKISKTLILIPKVKTYFEQHMLQKKLSDKQNLKTYRKNTQKINFNPEN